MELNFFGNLLKKFFLTAAAADIFGPAARHHDVSAQL